jgi:hypothetical protein
MKHYPRVFRQYWGLEIGVGTRAKILTFPPHTSPETVSETKRESRSVIGYMVPCFSGFRFVRRRCQYIGLYTVDVE